MSNAAIIDAWLAVELIPGVTKTAALADLSKTLGVRYTLSRLGEWRSGARPMPQPVRAFMLSRGIGVMLRGAGIPDLLYDDGKNFDQLARDLA